MKNFLLTGPPRCGKSTLIEKLVAQLKRPCTGFYTREIREKGRRVGFSIMTLAGEEGILAHERIKSPYRVGKYGVNLEDVDRVAVPAMMPRGKAEYIVIDEIGKMECFSTPFKGAVIKALDSPQTVIGSIALKGDQFIRDIRQREDNLLLEVSHANRDVIGKNLLQRVLVV